MSIVNKADLITAVEDTDYTFPVGAIFFSIENIPVDAPDSLVVELQLPLDTEIPANAVVRKLDNSGAWRTLTSSPSISESTPIARTITLTLLDNDVFDSNPAVGEIRDPVALAVPVTSANVDKSEDGKTSGSALRPLFLLLILGHYLDFINADSLFNSPYDAITLIPQDIYCGV